MSMLAEQKSKQPWVLNPRGKTEWSEDSNKFGQKLLEKMGWSQGKGLGPEENGITEHIKVKFRTKAQQGMGFKETDNQWTEHESNFSALLASLGAENGIVAETKLSSLEEKSESSRVRVHYKKFTRGKDLSRYSQKDLANIFGKKSLEPVKETKKINKQLKSITESFHVNSTSMLDYFRKKMPNSAKTNNYESGSNGVLKKTSDSEEETSCRGFGFDNLKTTDVTGFNGGDLRKRKSEDILDFAPIRKKSKKSDDETNEKNFGVSNPAFDPLCGNVKIARHCLNSIEEESEEIVEDPALNEEKCAKRRLGEKEIEEMGKGQKKKSKKSKKNYEENESTDSHHEQKSFEVSKKKKKSGNFEDTSNSSNFLEVSNGVTNGDSKKLKKNKKKKAVLAMDNPSFCETTEDSLEVKKGDTRSSEEESCNNPCSNGEFEVKRKIKKSDKKEFLVEEISVSTPKKKKVNQNGYLATDNPNFNEILEEEDNSNVSSNLEICRKTKKMKKNFAIDNPNFAAVSEDNPHNSNAVINNSGDFEVRRKVKKSKNLNEEENTVSEGKIKKSKKHKNSKIEENSEEVPNKSKKGKKLDNFAIDNPNFETLSIEDNSNYSNISEQFEVKRNSKKSKKKNELSIDNPSFSQISEESTVNSFEITRKAKKNKKTKPELAIDNPNFSQIEENGNEEKPSFTNNFEVTRKKDKKKKPELAIDNLSFSQQEIFEENLNIMSTPRRVDIKSTSILMSAKTSATKQRKSVRFSDVNEERIIPSNDSEKNELFDINNLVIASSLEDVTNLEIMAKKIDDCQSQIENDINEAKLKRSVGTPSSSYKHLINPGDLVVQFNEANFHERTGYCEGS